ncbi:divergent PAP2 family protein [Acholeplasma hippikon]|nr:divergent PAP2 family protein [Acholeplasma hippikon]
MISTANAVIIITISAMVIAQVLKFFIDFAINKKPNESILISTGGMPSSHSALVTSLVTAIGLFQIYDTGKIGLEFAISFVLALVVVHDSMGIRYEASKHARALNEIKLRLNLIENIDIEEKKFKESLGHKPKEVLAGILLGCLVAVLGFVLFRLI